MSRSRRPRSGQSPVVAGSMLVATLLLCTAVFLAMMVTLPVSYIGLALLRLPGERSTGSPAAAPV